MKPLEHAEERSYRLSSMNQRRPSQNADGFPSSGRQPTSMRADLLPAREFESIGQQIMKTCRSSDGSPAG
jgi:hypothetical protein